MTDKLLGWISRFYSIIYIFIFMMHEKLHRNRTVKLNVIEYERANAANWKWIFWLNYCSTAIICDLKIASCTFCCRLPASSSQSFFFLSWYQCIFIWLWTAYKISFNCLKLVFLAIFICNLWIERLNQCRRMGEILLWVVFVEFVQPFSIPLAYRLIWVVFTIRIEQQSNTSRLATDRRHAHWCQLILYHPHFASNRSLNLGIYIYVNLSIIWYKSGKNSINHQYHAPQNKNNSNNNNENNSNKHKRKITEICVVVFWRFICNLYIQTILYD